MSEIDRIIDSFREDLIRNVNRLFFWWYIFSFTAVIISNIIADVVVYVVMGE